MLIYDSGYSAVAIYCSVLWKLMGATRNSYRLFERGMLNGQDGIFTDWAKKNDEMKEPPIITQSFLLVAAFIDQSTE